METVFIYFLKSSALIAVFYLAYHFLVRKETFFNSNRWFLLIGLLTSVVMPLFFFKKVIFVEKPTLSAVDLATMSQQTSTRVQEIQTSAPIDWFQIVAIGYGIITCENQQQAVCRADKNQKNKCGFAVKAFLKMIEIKKRFQTSIKCTSKEND